MFDGNHRSRRTINLGGASSANRRRRRGNTTTTTTTTNKKNEPKNTTTTTGIRDHKSELLEAARIQREQRRIQKRQVDAVKLIQRIYRGWRGRAVLVKGLEEIKEEGVEKVVAVLCMKLSPALLPFLNREEENDKKSTVSKELHLILSLESLLSTTSKTTLSKFYQKSPSQYKFIMGRLAKRILLQLLQSCKFKKEENVRQRLIQILTTLLLLLPPSRDESKTKDDNIMTAINILNTSTNYKESLSDSKKEEEEGNGLILLFICFQELFWSSLHYQGTDKNDEEDIKSAASVLLSLSCNIAFAILEQEKQTQTKNRHHHDHDGKIVKSDAPSLLAAAIFCSGILLVDDNNNDTLKYKNSAREESWRKEFHSCFEQFYKFKTEDNMMMMMMEEDETKENQEQQSLWKWYTYLLSNLVSTLTRSSSSSSSSSSTPMEESIVTKTTLTMVQNRELYLLRNALDIFTVVQQQQQQQQPLSEEEKNDDGASFITLTNCIVQLLTHVLVKSDNQELAALSSLVAKGEDLGKFFSFEDDDDDGGKKKVIVDLTRQETDEDDEDDEEEDEDMGDESEDPSSASSAAAQAATSISTAAANQPATTTTTTTTVTSRYNTIKRHQKITRQELQTLPKLDKLYQNDWWKVRKVVLSSLLNGNGNGGNGDAKKKKRREYIQLMCILATQIGGGGGANSDLMVQLGTSLFCQSPLAAELQQEEDEDEEAKDAYVTLLSIILQSCTGLRSHGSDQKPLLTQLAFHPDLLSALWEYIINEKSTKTKAASAGGDGFIEALLCTFCELFSHYLLAVDDEEFIRKLTKVDEDSQFQKKGIIAEDVILYLRSVLHELYWTRPVTANDVMTPASAAAPTLADKTITIAKCHRARLILSGTKLWNALYERWCRLLRLSPFCDEQVWWFPRLVSRERDDDGVFILGENDASNSSRGGRSNAAPFVSGFGAMEEDGSDDDEMDEDSAASPMDVDNDDDDENNNNSSSTATAAADAESDALASSFRDPKMARILTSIPQSIPFDRRVKLFDSLLNADKARTQDESAAFRRVMMNMRNIDDMTEGDLMGREQVTIRRDNIYSDSMKSLNKLGRKLRKKVQVTFINKHGAVEAGIDGGGVFKEFLDDLITEAFNPEDAHAENGGHGPLFAVSPLQTLYVGVSPDASETYSSRVLSHYEFLGRVLGKAVYESILVEPQFCLPFLNKLLGKQNTLDDLKNLDPEYYKHLSALRKMSKEEIQDLGLSFELTIGSSDVDGKQGKKTLKTVELVPGGSSIPVTKQNVIRYVHLVAHRRMNVEGSRETHAFLRGFRDLIPAAWVRLFSAYELQKMISGDDTIKGIDVNSMRSVIQYAGGYHPSQPIIRWLWEVVEEMTPRQQRMFLKFMTSCSRQPLLGFHALVPTPCVQQIRLRDEEWNNARGGNEGSDVDGRDVRLPTSSTCMNLLKLPNYKTKEMLREKLVYAIESAAGFELS